MFPIPAFMAANRNSTGAEWDAQRSCGHVSSRASYVRPRKQTLGHGEQRFCAERRQERRLPAAARFSVQVSHASGHGTTALRPENVKSRAHFVGGERTFVRVRVPLEALAP